MIEVKRGPENPELIATIRALEKAYKRSRKRMWLKLAKLLLRPRRKRVEANIYDIEKHCRQGEVALVPGKLLSQGALSKSVTVAAFAATAQARKKIEQAGAKLVSLKDFAARGDAKNTRIIA